jgi:hypothetical protein
MPNRCVQARDVKSAVTSATGAQWKVKDQSWKLTGGTDFDGDQLDVAVTIDGTYVCVVTVF